MDYRQFYIDNKGDIPLDENGISFEIHHIDGNRDNNEIDNLVALSVREHYNIHVQQGDWMAAFLISKRLDLTLEEKEFLRKASSQHMKTSNPSALKVKAGEQHWARGKGVYIDKEGRKFRADKEDPRVLAGALPINKGRMMVKDSLGNTLQVDANDPRVLSGILVSVNLGKKRLWVGTEAVVDLYASRRGRKWTKERRDKQAEMIEKRKPVSIVQVTCPHCGKQGKEHGMLRWHFNNCRSMRNG